MQPTLSIFFTVACVFIHQCADDGIGDSSSSPCTPSSCVCHAISLIISFIIIHQCVDNGVGDSSSSPYTPSSCMCHVIFINHFTITFISLSGVPSCAQSYQHLLVRGVRFTEHQPSLLSQNLLISILHSPGDLSAISRISFVTSYYIYITLLVCTCH